MLFKADFNYVDHDGYPADASTITSGGGAVQAPLSTLFNISSSAARTSAPTIVLCRLSLNAGYTLGDGILLRSITGYQSGITTQGVDLEAGGVSFTDYGRERVISEELNAVSPDKGPFRWVAGLYLQSDTVDIPEGGFDIKVPSIIDINPDLTTRRKRRRRSLAR